MSYGVAVVRQAPAARSGLEVLLVQRRYTYEFSEFVHGKYAARCPRKVATMLNNMSVDERLDVYSLNFDQMWYRVWLDAERGDLYRKKLAKFHAVWLRDDGGSLLRRLVREAHGIPAPRWDFPKGRRRTPKEPDVNCAVREFEEETGIAKADYRLLPRFRRRLVYRHIGVTYVSVLFVALARRDVTPAVDFAHGHQVAEVGDVRWMSVVDLRAALPARRAPSSAPCGRYSRSWAGTSGAKGPPKCRARRRSGSHSPAARRASSTPQPTWTASRRPNGCARRWLRRPLLPRAGLAKMQPGVARLSSRLGARLAVFEQRGELLSPTLGDFPVDALHLLVGLLFRLLEVFVLVLQHLVDTFAPCAQLFLAGAGVFLLVEPHQVLALRLEEVAPSLVYDLVVVLHVCLERGRVELARLDQPAEGERKRVREVLELLPQLGVQRVAPCVIV
jgi:8-oxo-dGTP pyrophosphatase MutT (NUDIX family)